MAFNCQGHSETGARKIDESAAGVARWRGPGGERGSVTNCRSSLFGFTVVGFLDDNPKKRANDAGILGTLDDTRAIIRDQRVDDVIIAMSTRAYERVNQLVAELHDLPVCVWIIPDYFHLALHKAVAEDFAGLPMLDLRAPAAFLSWLQPKNYR